jgi:hypothetical protein
MDYTIAENYKLLKSLYVKYHRPGEEDPHYQTIRNIERYGYLYIDDVPALKSLWHHIKKLCVDMYQDKYEGTGTLFDEENPYREDDELNCCYIIRVHIDLLISAAKKLADQKGMS